MSNWNTDELIGLIDVDEDEFGGHGVPASTDTDLLRRLVDAVHEATRR